ncbi:MAG: ABC transporter permease subunit [Actinomycetia bacterium]|nr:ABC transporter permease subunit [Actinomycetes bacterium]
MADTLKERIPVTAEIMLLSMLVALIISLPLGSFAAYRSGSKADEVTTTISFALLSMPTFILAIALIIIFAVRLKWLPATGWAPLDESVTEILRTELDVDTRYAAAAEISRITSEAATQFWSGSGSTNVVVSPDVGGIDEYTWPDGTAGTRQDRGRVYWNTVWIDGAEALDIPTNLIEEPEEAPLPPADEAALAALPGLDSLPATFAENDPSYIFAQCPGFIPLEMVNPVTISEKAYGAPGDFGPFANMLILDLPEGEAEIYMDAYAAADCAEYDSVSATGAPLHFVTETLDVSAPGDRTDGWALRGDSAGFPVNVDLVLTKVGNGLTITSWLAIGGMPDLAVTDALATEVHAAAAGLG